MRVGVGVSRTAARGPDVDRTAPWDRIDPQAQIAALVLLSRLIAQKAGVEGRAGETPMNDPLKITSSHLTRAAIVYLRQSSAAQVEP